MLYLELNIIILFFLQYNPPLFNKIPKDQKEDLVRHGFFSTFPVAVVVILHFLTFGLFTTIYMGLKHSKLPLIKHDDFSAGKAIGFLFIPFFNIYWYFVFWLRLVDRINFQHKLRNQPELIPKALMITTLILALIPYANMVGVFILMPICVGLIQSACNKLALSQEI